MCRNTGGFGRVDGHCPFFCRTSDGDPAKSEFFFYFTSKAKCRCVVVVVDTNDDFTFCSRLKFTRNIQRRR